MLACRKVNIVCCYKHNDSVLLQPEVTQLDLSCEGEGENRGLRKKLDDMFLGTRNAQKCRE